MIEITENKTFENFMVDYHYSKNRSDFVIIKNINSEPYTILHFF